MKMNVKVGKVFLILMLCVLSITGCKKSDTGTSNSTDSDMNTNKKGLSYKGELIFSGLENEFKVPYNDIFKMDSVTTEVKHISSSGEESVDKVTGVILDTILKEKGISQKDFSLIRFIAGDGYAIDVTSDILKDKDIILAYKFNGDYLDEKKQPLRVAINDVRSLYFVSNLATIEFVKESNTSMSSDSNSPQKVIILETATNHLESDIYTYYESEDQAIKVADLWNAYVKQEVNVVKFMASDGFEKSEDVDVLKQGYIKTTGKDIPLFTAPDLPKGMHVKYILTLTVGDTIFASAFQGIASLEKRIIDEKTGVALDVFMDKVGLDSDYYLFTSSDGYQVELSKKSLSKGIIYLDNTSQYKVIFDESLPKSASIKDILSIEASEGTNAVVGATQAEGDKNDNKASDNHDISWTITVDGLSDGSFDFTSDRAERKLERVQLHTERIKNDQKKPEDWEGYKILDVLSFLKVEDFNALVIRASDGFEIELSKEQIDDETILAVVKNGEPLTDTDNLVQLVQNTEFSSSWVKGVSKITVK